MRFMQNDKCQYGKKNKYNCCFNSVSIFLMDINTKRSKKTISENIFMICSC